MAFMFLRYPFNRPRYNWKVLSECGTFVVDYYRHLVDDFLKAQGEAEFMLNV